MKNVTNILGTILLLSTLIFASYYLREYIHTVLRWLESQSNTVVFFILVCLYIWVSLPFAWGYIMMTLATGYLYGMKVGIVVTVTSAAVGIFMAHLFNKAFLVKYIERLLVNRATEGSLLGTVRCLLSSQQNAFQLAFLARLTPIPFGIQNSLFALSPISTRDYLQASVVGMFPCQAINVYLGSTVRSMEEVLGNYDANTATIGLMILLCQLFFASLLILFVIQKAKKQVEYLSSNQSNNVLEVITVIK